MTNTYEYLDKHYNHNLHTCVRNTSGMVSGIIGIFSGALLGVIWPVSLPVILGNYIVKHPSITKIYNHIQNSKKINKKNN